MSLKSFVKIMLVVSLLLMPFWVTAILFIFSIFYFDYFYFGLLVMFVLDLLYGFETVTLHGIPGIVFFSSVILFLLSFLVKRFITIRHNYENF